MISCRTSSAQPHSAIRPSATCLLVLALTGCGDPEKPPAEAAFSMSQASDPTPEAGTLPCSAPLGRLMFPAQEGTLVLSGTTPETTVTEGMNLLVNGREGAEVQCSVRETGAGAFEVSGTLEGGGRLQFRASIAGQFSTYGWMYWLYQGFDYTADGTCGFNVDTRGDLTPFIGDGEAKLTYSCDPLKNEDNQSCVATGTIYMRNCSE